MMRKQKSDLSETLKEEFKKDLQLFEHFLVLLNHSSPIRNVELMWLMRKHQCESVLPGL